MAGRLFSLLLRRQNGNSFPIKNSNHNRHNIGSVGLIHTTLCYNKVRVGKGFDISQITKNVNLNNIKTYKVITLNDKTGEHDLNFKINNIKKWLAKGFYVKTTIVNQLADPSGPEQMYKNFVEELKSEGVCVHKQVSNKELKFTIEPKPVANKESKEKASDTLNSTEPQKDSSS